MPFHQAAAFIPSFDGDPDSLNLFCTAVRKIMNAYGPDFEDYMLLHIATKLKGKATEGYRARTANYESVEKLLNDLTLHFANIGIADQIHTQLRAIKQGPNEPVGDYGMRVDKLYNRLHTIINSAPDLSPVEREFRSNRAKEDVLEQFLFGLRGPLDHQVRHRSPGDLGTAMRIAIEFEGKQSGRDACNATPPAAKPSAQVRRAIAEEDDSLADPEQGEQGKNSEDVQGSAEPNRAHCSYCDIPGHSLENCRILVKHAAKRLIVHPPRNNNNNKNGKAGPNNKYNNNNQGKSQGDKNQENNNNNNKNSNGNRGKYQGRNYNNRNNNRDNNSENNNSNNGNNKSNDNRSDSRGNNSDSNRDNNHGNNSKNENLN